MQLWATRTENTCGFFPGPLKWMKLKKNDTFAYEYYLILGTVEDIRGFAYEKQGKTLKRD